MSYLRDIQTVRDWNSFQLDYRYHETPYHITVWREDASHPAGITLDGNRIPDHWISLVDDHQPHTAEFVLAARQDPPRPKAKRRAGRTRSGPGPVRW